MDLSNVDHETLAPDAQTGIQHQAYRIVGESRSLRLLSGLLSELPYPRIALSAASVSPLIVPWSGTGDLSEARLAKWFTMMWNFVHIVICRYQII